MYNEKFKISKVIILILTNLVFNLAKSSTSSWYFDKAINGVEFWKNKDQPSCRIVVDKIYEKSNQPLAFYKSEEFRKRLQERKKTTLSILGISDWSVNIVNTYELDGKIIIDFTGEYKGVDNEKTYYQEEHIYTSNKSTQFLYSCSDEIKNYPEIVTSFKWIQTNQESRQK